MAGQAAALSSRRRTELGGPGDSGSSTDDRDKHGRQRTAEEQRREPPSSSQTSWPAAQSGAGLASPVTHGYMGFSQFFLASEFVLTS